MEISTLGLHGKLPAHADFVSRCLPAAFVSGWDDWLQLSIAASQSALGNQWLQIYLTSPVWRFVLSAGILDNQVWAGVLIPSVDKVGRYYPFAIVQALPGDTLPTALLVEHNDWFRQIEACALAGLQDGATVDDVLGLAAGIEAPNCASVSVSGSWQVGKPLALFMEQSNQNALSVYPTLLHSFLLQRFPGYSLWHSEGSDRVMPAQLISGNLPAPKAYASLLAGDWGERGWSTPFGAVAPLAYTTETVNH